MIRNFFFKVVLFLEFFVDIDWESFGNEIVVRNDGFEYVNEV